MGRSRGESLKLFASLLLSVVLILFFQVGCSATAGPPILCPPEEIVELSLPVEAPLPAEEVAPQVSEQPILFRGTYPGADEDTTLLLSWVRSGRINVYEGPSSDDSVLGAVEVKRGEALEWTETCVLVTETYRMKALRDQVLASHATPFDATTQEYSETSVSLSVRAGEWVGFVKYTGEGECLVRVDGVVYGIFCPDWKDFEGGEDDEKIRSTQRFWVRISSGWVEVTDDEMRLTVQGPTSDRVRSSVQEP